MATKLNPRSLEDLDTLVDELLAKHPKGKYISLYGVVLGDTKLVPKILELDREALAGLAARFIEELAWFDSKSPPGAEPAVRLEEPRDEEFHQNVGHSRDIAVSVLHQLLRRRVPLADQALLDLLRWLAEAEDLGPNDYPLGSILTAVENRAAKTLFSDDLTVGVHSVIDRLSKPPRRRAMPENQVHPTKAYLDSWIARILSLKNSLSRNPYACRFTVLILLLVPSKGPVLIGWS